MEQTDFKNIIVENIHWALFEDAKVAEVKRPRNSKRQYRYTLDLRSHCPFLLIVRHRYALDLRESLLHQFFTFLDPPTRVFDDLQYCKSSKIAIF